MFKDLSPSSGNLDMLNLLLPSAQFGFVMFEFYQRNHLTKQFDNGFDIFYNANLQ